MLFWSIPPDDSPSRIFGNRWLCRNAWQNSQEHLAVSACTVLDRGFHRNRKATPLCAETVDDRNFLWKRAEKLEKTKIGRGESHRRARGIPSCALSAIKMQIHRSQLRRCILRSSSPMTRPFLRVTRWLGTITIEAQCMACPASVFKAQFTGHRPELAQCQRSLQNQFDEHVRQAHPPSDAPPENS